MIWIGIMIYHFHFEYYCYKSKNVLNLIYVYNYNHWGIHYFNIVLHLNFHGRFTCYVSRSSCSFSSIFQLGSYIFFILFLDKYVLEKYCFIFLILNHFYFLETNFCLKDFQFNSINNSLIIKTSTYLIISKKHFDLYQSLPADN